MSTILPIDAIQEFNLEENPKAEYGWKPGAVVNVGIRSGTNQFHGSAYAFGRNGSWDARSVFNPAPNPVLPVELKQFGGVAGGPINQEGRALLLRWLRGPAFQRRQLVYRNCARNRRIPNPGSEEQHGGCYQCAADRRSDAQPHQPEIAGLHLGANRLHRRAHRGANPSTTTYASTSATSNISDNGVGKIDYNINSKHRPAACFGSATTSAMGTITAS
jgi:hypothetical protein